jgi:hypothetical protein
MPMSPKPPALKIAKIPNQAHTDPMSAITHVVKSIRALPYADMMLVAEEVRDRIQGLTQHRIEAIVLADILARIKPNTVTLQETTDEEEKVLREIFRVKRSLTIQRQGVGWIIDVPTVPAGQVIGVELRPMFNMMLDQIITLHVLQK